MNLFSHSSGDSMPYNPTVWAIQNRWFQRYSSLDGALGEQGNREVSPGALEKDQGHEPILVPFSAPGGHLHQPTPGAAARVESEATPESDDSGGSYECGYQQRNGDTGGTCNNDGNDIEVLAVANLHGDVPKFCRVGDCRYWHTEPKQIWRHRDGHFSDRHGYLCPNRTGTCRNPGWDFRRSDAVIVHCRGSPECARALEDNRGKIPCWGTPASEEDLRPEDWRFHIPYETFDGRTRRSRGRGQF